jgi:hypothetical protein
MDMAAIKYGSVEMDFLVIEKLFKKVLKILA